jgi:hypothetical protein
MTTLFMLALLSAFVRWLRLCRVRALKPSQARRKTGHQDLHQTIFARIECFSEEMRLGFSEPNLDIRHTIVDGNQANVHAFESASARARRQAPTVLELREKRQTLKLEFA